MDVRIGNIIIKLHFHAHAMKLRKIAGIILPLIWDIIVKKIFRLLPAELKSRESHRSALLAFQ